jgi:small GTP-binding protein
VIQKKICLMGAYAVGKTSLVARFVHSIFSEKYHTTLGVKIDKKIVATPGGEVMLMIWDLAGEDEFISMDLDYMRGAAGYILVADGTRRASLERAIALQNRICETVGPVPFLLLINKADLENEWEIEAADMELFSRAGWRVLRTSAKTGEGVDSAFISLAASLLPSK